MAKPIENRPRANILMSSMRAMGYTFESAIADVLDNSITAQARNIQIVFPTDPVNCYIAIYDDGNGMLQNELYEAMRYGSALGGDVRTECDLGRFGLGLKSASLSQCKRLTVVSKKDAQISAYLWDLNFVEQQKDWIIQELDANEIYSVKEVTLLNNCSHGTLVVWENFDLIEKSTGDVFTSLTNYREETAKYLSFIFHRFLNADIKKKVIIKINQFSLEGYDPFLESHNKTNPRKEIILPIKDTQGVEKYISVKPYVLPFQKDMSNYDLNKIGGIENYRTKQGFYIYRNERLIIWGTWFGQPKSELTKNARVKVDIPNTLDDIWGIDIKKQMASIPLKIKIQLKRAVEEAMDIALKSQEYRGRKEKVNDNIDYIWDRIKERNDRYLYKINRNSRIFDILKDQFDNTQMSYLEMLLEEIEDGVPYQQIYIDMSNHKISDDVDEERLKDIFNKAMIIINLSHKMGQSNIDAILDKLFSSEPFCKHPKMKKKLYEEYSNGN